MEWVRNHIILTTKNFQYHIRGNEKVCQTCWCRVTIAGHNYNYKQKQQGNPAEGKPSTKILEILNGSSFVKNILKLNEILSFF